MDARLEAWLASLLFSISAGFARNCLTTLAPLVLDLCLTLRQAAFAALLKEMRFFAAIIFIVIALNAFTIPGAPISRFPRAALPGQE